MFSLDQSQIAFLQNMILGVGVLGVLLMGFDKLMAVSGNYRLSERFLWLLALAGGFWGVILDGILFHHKTHKPSFWIPVAIAVMVWAAASFEILL
jgi:uncharacterized membrane protein YsdA (DUF1294 family)